MMFSAFDPQLKITSTEGKVFDPTSAVMRQVRELPEIELSCETLQENALVRYGDRQEISVIKGIDSTFRHLTLIDTVIIDGAFKLRDGDAYYAVLGIGLASALGINAAFAYPMEIYMPKRTESVNLANPSASAQVEYVLVGGVYQLNQPVYDEGFMLAPMEMLRSMLDYEKEVSAIELKLRHSADIASVKKTIASLLGSGFRVRDRYEQQEASFKMVQIEKWVTFLMLCFILVMALFNVLGSLAILMIEKEDDVSKLRGMGADNTLINRIFLFEGWMISLFGGAIGVVIGIGLCLLQQHFGLISLGATAGAFVVDAYPVLIEWTDVLLVFLTVVLMGFVAVLYPIHFLGKKWLNKGVAVCLSLPLIIACGGGKKDSSASAGAGENNKIAVTIEPLRYFGEKIAGGDYEFFSVIPVGQGPETYDPSPVEIVRVAKGQAYFHINQFTMEQLLVKSVEVNNPKVFIADLSRGMKFEDHIGHHDPHFWTSFEGAKAISAEICHALVSMNEGREDYYMANYKTFIDEIQALEDTLRRQMENLSCRTFVIYHPALTYFAKELGFRQLSIEDDNKEPSSSSMKQLIDEAKSAGVKVVFTQVEFDTKHAQQIAAEIGARLVVINPLDSQWDMQMKRIVKALVSDGKVD